MNTDEPTNLTITTIIVYINYACPLSRYFHMLKIGLSTETVLHALKRDGNDPELIFGRKEDDKQETFVQPVQAKTHRHTRLHWQILSQAQVGENSVWSLLEKDMEHENLRIDEVEFSRLFSTVAKQQRYSDLASSSKVVNVIDQRRANNGGIVLARLKESYQTVAVDIEQV